VANITAPAVRRGILLRPLIASSPTEKSIFPECALRQTGYEVIAMNDGLAGLEATSAEAPYDLVVTNNPMPRLSGARWLTRH
jgi:DNA-binding response OmpR family regulator